MLKQYSLKIISENNSIVLTTTSLAINPVRSDIEVSQEPKPSGLNIGAIPLPIDANKLSLISTIPVKLKLDKNQTTTEIDKIIVPAFFKKPLPLSQVCIARLFHSGSLYSGSSIIKAPHLF